MIHLIEQYWFYLFPQIIITALLYFGMFVVLNGMEKHKGKWFYYPTVAIPVLLLVVSDFILQIELSVLFVDLPREWLVTSRMERYKELSMMHSEDLSIHEYIIESDLYDKLSWLNKVRYVVAVFVCEFLNKNGQKKDHC